MARITVDDCLDHIPNRFKLTLAATYRARELVAQAFLLAQPGFLGRLAGSLARGLRSGLLGAALERGAQRLEVLQGGV